MSLRVDIFFIDFLKQQLINNWYVDSIFLHDILKVCTQSNTFSTR